MYMILKRTMMLTNELVSADLLKEYLKEKRNRLNVNNNNLIYHYCSSLTFPEIIKSNELWLTPITKLNDDAEGTWICNYINTNIFHQMFALQREKDSINTEAQNRIYNDFYVKSLPLINEYIHKIIPYQFVCCFSEEPDSLNQFRLYADDCKGYALGFNIYSLNYNKITLGFPTHVDKEGFYLCPVIYDRKLQDRIVTEQINKAVVEYQRNWKLEDFLSVIQQLATIACVFKHPSFHEEKEWRLIYTRSQKEPNSYEQKFTHKDNYLSAYYSLNFKTEKILLKDIIIGSRNLSFPEHIEIFLKAYGFDFRYLLDLKKSESTYRGKL